MKKRSGLKRTGSMIVFGLISVVIFLWTAYLTTSFLGTVLPGAFWVVPYLGLVVFDGGMIGWMFVYLYLAEGSMQRTIALGLTVFNLIGVGLMTIAEIVLGGQTFAEVPAMLGTAAIWAVGIWTFVNVAGIVAFHLSSPDAKIAAAIQEEKDAVTEDALTDLRNRRSDNAKLLSAQLGAGMFKTLVSELGADMDGDGLPDVTERPSNRGRAYETAADVDLEDLVTYLVEERLRERGGLDAALDLYQVAKANNFTPEEAARAIVGMRHNYHEGDRSTPPPNYDVLTNGNGHGASDARPTQRPDGR